jgi:hypothetical protein
VQSECEQQLACLFDASQLKECPAAEARQLSVFGCVPESLQGGVERLVGATFMERGAGVQAAGLQVAILQCSCGAKRVEGLSVLTGEQVNLADHAMDACVLWRGRDGERLKQERQRVGTIVEPHLTLGEVL